jgi:hypothetical protein
LRSFYGFPDHYYKEKYPNVGSKEVSHKVLDALKEAGIEAKGVKRGLDHGVWASFKCGTSYRVHLYKYIPLRGLILMARQHSSLIRTH